MKYRIFICATLMIIKLVSSAAAAEMTVQGVPPHCGISLEVGKANESRFVIRYKSELKEVDVDECQCPVSSRVLSIVAAGADPQAAARSYELPAEMASAELEISLSKDGSYVASVRCICEKCLKPSVRN